MSDSEPRVPGRPPRRWAWATRMFLVLAVLFAGAFVASCFYRWMAGDALEGSSRLDYGVHHGAVWVVYYETQISWMAVHRGGRFEPQAPRLWPRIDVKASFPKGWHTIGIPLWIPAALSTLGFVGFRAMGRRRGRRGACPACGYDIGIEEARICPECGRSV